jgi:hypothetical protein
VVASQARSCELAQRIARSHRMHPHLAMETPHCRLRPSDTTSPRFRETHGTAPPSHPPDFLAFARASLPLNLLEDMQTDRPPLGFLPLRRFRMLAATHVGFASPDYHAPSGSLNLMTPSSASILSAFFHAESVPEVLLSEASLSQ